MEGPIDDDAVMPVGDMIAHMSNGEEEVDEIEEVPSEDYDAEDFAELELEHDYPVMAPNLAADRFGANWSWADSTAGGRQDGGRAGGGLASSIPEPASFRRSLGHAAWPRRRAGVRADLPPYGTPEDVASHPSLVDRPPDAQSQAQSGQRLSRRRMNAPGALAGGDSLMNALEAAVGGGAVEFLEALLTRARGMGEEEVRLSITAPADGNPPHVHVDGVPVEDLRRGRGARDAVSKPKTIITALQEFVPMSTISRWHQEASIAQPQAMLRTERTVRNEVQNALLPSYWQRRKAEKAKKETEKAKKEQEKKEKQEKQEEKRKLQAQADEAAAAEATLAAQSAEASAAITTAASNSAATEGATATGDTDMDEGTRPNLELNSLQQGLSELSRAADTAGSETAAGPSSAAAASTSTGPRTTVTVRGRQVDITDSGIDIEFLEALPDEMREEIIEQHLRDQQAAALTAEGNSSIAPEFLEALPPDIRAEVIQQEILSTRVRRAEQAAREQQEAQQNEDEVPSSPLEEFPDAGANASGAGETSQRAPATSAGAATSVPKPAQESPKKPPPRDAIQLLDKAGIIALVRLLFFPQLDAKGSGLHRVLTHLAENSRTRSELLTLLLAILWDGTYGAAAVDRSFAAMTAKIQKSLATPKSGRKSTLTPGGSAFALQTPSVAPVSGTGEEAPHLIALRCVECLTHLANHNDQVAKFFLREEARPTRRGKGKEKPGVAPIATLLALLERPLILEHSPLMDSLIAL